MSRRRNSWGMGSKVHQRPQAATRLADWMQEQNVTTAQLMRALGAGRKVEYWVSGRCLPNLVWAFKLEKYTHSEVPASSWLETPLATKMWKAEGSEATR